MTQPLSTLLAALDRETSAFFEKSDKMTEKHRSALDNVSQFLYNIYRHYFSCI